MKNKYLHLLLFWFGTFGLAAQTPVFRQHPLRELGDVRMTTAFQDGRGWLWFGAEQGLFRYDGTSFQPFAPPDSLQNRAVSALAEFGDTLWVGFRGGSIGFVPKSGDFRAPASMCKDGTAPGIEMWSPEEGTPAQAITGFAADGAGGFWFSTYGEGLYCLKNKRLYQFDAADDGLTGDEIYALASDGKGRIWAATDNGISICAMPAPGKKIVSRLTRADGLPDEIITVLLADAKGNIWLGTDQRGVCCYDIEKQAFTYASQDWQFGAVTSLALFEGVELWVGTAADGPLRLDLAAGNPQVLPEKHALRRAKIRALRKDREGLLWAVSDKGAVFSAHARFGLLETPFPATQALLADSRGRFWAGCAEGLFLETGNWKLGNLKSGSREIAQRNPPGQFPISNFKQTLPGKQNVISLCETADGNIWAGTFGNGVFVLGPDGRVLRQLTERDGLANGSILSIASAGPKVWLATLGGVVEADLKAGQVPLAEQFTHRNELGTSYVYKVFADSRGRVWFGTDGKGLARLEHGQFQRFAEAAGRTLKTVYCIAEDADGRIWFSTDRDGLFCFDGTEFRHFDRANGLHSTNITGLATDGNGQLVVAYAEGFDILTPRTGHVAFFDVAAGAPMVENNLNALCRDGRGHVWLGSQQGILRIAAFQEPFAIDPQTRLRAVSLFLKPIDFQAQTSFEHDENYFIFDFTGLWYANPEAVRYRFKLDGFDPDWKTAKDHLASYPNLPPGRYTFRVQSTEHGRFEGTPEATFGFVIHKPIWARWWFVLLASAAMAGCFYWFVREREARLRQEQELKKQAVEARFAALKSQINPHFLFNSFNTLITIIEENPAVAVRYVEHLADFYRSMMVHREKDLISLHDELELLRDFGFLLKRRYEDNLLLHITANGQPGEVMPLTLQMLVENAVKHNVISKAKPLTVDVFVEEGGQYIVVRNNLQRKIKPEPSTHFGLQSLVNRYRLLGERQVEVAEADGFFTVRVPIL